MNEKKTEELQKILGSTHISQFDSYLQTQQESLLSKSSDFYAYVRELLAAKEIKQ